MRSSRDVGVKEVIGHRRVAPAGADGPGCAAVPMRSPRPCRAGQEAETRLPRPFSICRSRSTMQSVRLPTREDSENRNQPEKAAEARKVHVNTKNASLSPAALLFLLKLGRKATFGSL